MKKFIITAELRDLEKQFQLEEISYSKMVELLNEKAEKYVEDNSKKQWVDVMDRLPRHTKEVLVVDMKYGDGYYGIGSCMGNEGWAIKGSNHWNPTHWKELDKPL